MSPRNSSDQYPFVTDDRSAAERDARRRRSQQQIEYFLGTREYFEGEVEYIVAPMDDFHKLRDSGGWLIDDSYGRLITPDNLVAPLSAWPRFAAVDWEKLDEFKATRS